MKPGERELWKLAALMSTVGVAMVLATFLGLAVGLWLDRRLHTPPIFTILFLILGIAAGFWNLWKLAQRTFKK